MKITSCQFAEFCLLLWQLIPGLWFRKKESGCCPFISLKLWTVVLWALCWIGNYNDFLKNIDITIPQIHPPWKPLQMLLDWPKWRSILACYYKQQREGIGCWPAVVHYGHFYSSVPVDFFFSPRSPPFFCLQSNVNSLFLITTWNLREKKIQEQSCLEHLLGKEAAAQIITSKGQCRLFGEPLSFLAPKKFLVHTGWKMIRIMNLTGIIW